MFFENTEQQSIYQENFLLNNTDNVDNLIENFEEVLIDETKTDL